MQSEKYGIHNKMGYHQKVIYLKMIKIFGVVL